jgi:hypothetical protein
MRTYTHIVDSKAVRAVLNQLPIEWVVRSLTERDYGIDLMVELFDSDGSDKNGKAKYRSTGWTAVLQIKGTEIQNAYKKKELSTSLDVDFLLYAERFALPFVLFYVYVGDGDATIHFLWIQRYIKDVLDEHHPGWRTQKKKRIIIPSQNVLPSNLTKLIKICRYYRYLEESAEYIDIYSHLKYLIDKASRSELVGSEIDGFIKLLGRVTRLYTLLQINECQVDATSVQRIMDFLETNVKPGISRQNAISEKLETELFHMELLSNDNIWRRDIENLIAENDDEVLY